MKHLGGRKATKGNREADRHPSNFYCCYGQGYTTSHVMWMFHSFAPIMLNMVALGL
jgi:hypothetical protein